MHISTCCKEKQEDGSRRAKGGMCRSSDGSIPAFRLVALQGNLGKILFSSLARLQQTAGLTHCDIYFWCKRAKRPTLNTNVKPSVFLRQTHTHKSLKTRRASPLLTEPLGTQQEHRGEGAADLPFSVTSQRAPALLPFHKQPKDRRAGCGKWRRYGEGQLPNTETDISFCLGKRPGLHLSDPWQEEKEKSSQQDGITENEAGLNGWLSRFCQIMVNLHKVHKLAFPFGL